MSALKIHNGTEWITIPQQGSASWFIDQSGGTSDTYGVLAGLVNGSNTLFTVSAGKYVSGTLKVYLNGQLMTQGTGEDWVETSPTSGTFTFNIAPETDDEITVCYYAANSTLGNASLLGGYSPTAFVQKANADDITHTNDSDWTLKNSAEDKDILVTINDGGTQRTAIQIHGDEGSVSFPRQSYVRLEKTSDQTIATSTDTVVQWQQAGEDILGEADLVNNRVTVKTAGVYLIMAHNRWTTGNYRTIQEIRVNAKTQAYNDIHQANANPLVHISYAVRALTVGQYVDVRVQQTSGSNKTLRGLVNNTFFVVTKIA